MSAQTYCFAKCTLFHAQTPLGAQAQEARRDETLMFQPSHPFSLIFRPSFPFSPCSLSHHSSPLHLPLYPPFFVLTPGKLRFSSDLGRGPRMGCWIRGRWIRVWGAPDFGPKSLQNPSNKGFGASGLKIGAPQKRRFDDHRSNAPFSALWL